LSDELEPRELDIVSITHGILADLQALRLREISVPEARARAELARQALRAVGFTLQAQKFLAGAAKTVAIESDVVPPSNGKGRGRGRPA
jgi:hypothetical protein